MSSWLERVRSIIGEQRDEPLELSDDYKQLYDTLEEHADDVVEGRGWYDDPNAPPKPVPPPPDPRIVGTLGGSKALKVVRNADGEPAYIPLPIDVARELVKIGERADAETKKLREELASMRSQRDRLASALEAAQEAEEARKKKKKLIRDHYYRDSTIGPGCMWCQKDRDEHLAERDVWGNVTNI